jgi:hypothetical protein
MTKQLISRARVGSGSVWYREGGLEMTGKEGKIVKSFRSLGHIFWISSFQISVSKEH